MLATRVYLTRHFDVFAGVGNLLVDAHLEALPFQSECL